MCCMVWLIINGGVIEIIEDIPFDLEIIVRKELQIYS
jgi:hypothetical protein